MLSTLLVSSTTSYLSHCFVFYHFPLRVTGRAALIIWQSTCIFLQHLNCNCTCHWHHPHHHPHQHPTCRIVLYNFTLFITWRAALTISQSILIFSPCLILNYPCHQNYSYHDPHRHRTHRVLPIPSTLPASSLISYLSCHVVLYNFPLTVTWVVVPTISQSTSIFSLCLICNCPCCRYHPQLHPHRHCTHRVLLMPSMLPASSSTSYLSRYIQQLPPGSVPLKVVLTILGITLIFSQRLIHDCLFGRHHHWMWCSGVLVLGKLSLVNRYRLNIINRTRLSHNCLIFFTVMYHALTAASRCYHRDALLSTCYTPS